MGSLHLPLSETRVVPLPFSFPQAYNIVSLLNPAADAAGRTSVYVTLKNVAKAFIVCHITQGNAATVALNVLQAKDVAGTSSKALGNAVPIYADLDAVASDLLTAQTPGVTFTTDAGLKNKIVVFEIPVEALDVANGFKTIAIQTGASNAANITAAVAYLAGQRFQGATLPSALVN